MSMCNIHIHGTKVYNLSQLGAPVSFLECRDEECENYVIMDIGEPVTITSRESFGRSNSFTTYLIRLETNYPTFSSAFSAVRRRYSEFCWLRDQISRNHPYEVVPRLPPKKFLKMFNFQASFIRQRLDGLSMFLQRVLETPQFLSDPALLFFLQSDLSVSEMVKSKGQQNLSLAICEQILSPNEPIEIVEEDISSSINSQDICPGRLERRLSTESEDSDRTTSDDSEGYDSSKADSGHFEESSGGSSSNHSITPKFLSHPPPKTPSKKIHDFNYKSPSKKSPSSPPKHSLLQAIPSSTAIKTPNDVLIGYYLMP